MYKKCFLNSMLNYLKMSKYFVQWHATYMLPVGIGNILVIKQNRNVQCLQRELIHTHRSLNSEKSVVTQDFFDRIQDKSKDTFLDMIRIYETQETQRRGHVEFIYAALRHMEEFGVQKDLEVYKSLIDILPKGKFIPTNIFQAEFFHYPKQQQCIIDLLEQMEDNGVMPDPEMETQLINIFGKRGHPVRKYWRMMYWMPKFKHLSPWPLPNPVPNDSLELAKLALSRISSVDLQAVVKVYKASELVDSVDDTWIVSAQSPVQRELLDMHPHDVTIFVEGAFRLWLRNASVSYFILRADPRPKASLAPEDFDDVGNLKLPMFEEPSTEQALIKQPSVHEQEDGTIFAMCATGTSSRDSVLSWIRCLEADGNPALADIPVIFKSKSPLGNVTPISDASSANITEQISGSDKQEH